MPDNDARLHLLRLLGRLFAWTVALLVSGMVYLLFHDVYQRILRPPPFYFSSAIHKAERVTYCPGETVMWRPQLIVTRAPTLLVVARTVWSVPEQRTTMPETEPKYFVWTELETGSPVSRPAQLTLPTTLNPGAYEIRSAATAFNSDAATYRVPFVVPRGCGTNGAAPLKGD